MKTEAENGGLIMNSLLYCFIIIIFYMFFSYLLGDLFLRFSSSGESSVSCCVLAGFFCYFLLFQIVALPLKFTLQPLSLLTTIWCVVLAAIILLYLAVSYKNIKFKMQKLMLELSEQKQALFFLSIIIIIQLCLINYNGETYALWDQSYYIGDVSSSVYTNTISQYDPYTGAALTVLSKEYLLETYQNHSAVLCQITGLSPLIVTRSAEASVVVILANLIYYQFGLKLFQNSRRKSVILVFVLFWLNLFSFNLFTGAEFLFFRPFEGKTILVNLIMPMVFLQFVKIVQAPDRCCNWRELLLVVTASFGLNMSAVYMLPFELSICLIPLGIYQKNLTIWKRYVICLFPCILYGAAYLITKHSFFIYT